MAPGSENARDRWLRLGALLSSLGLCAHAGFGPISIAGTQIGLGVAAAGLAAALFGGWRPARTQLDLPIAALVAVCLLSELTADGGPPDPGHATLWRSAAGFWVVWQALRVVADAGRTAQRMLALSAAGLLLGSLVGIWQYRSGIDVLFELHLRAVPARVLAPGVDGRFGAMGFFTSRLSFGHNALVYLSLFAGVLAAGAAGRKLRALLGAASLLGLVALVLTFDRAAWLGLFAALGALLLATLLRTGARRAWAALAALLPVLAALLAWAPFRSRLLSGLTPGANRDRVFIWARALEVIRDHPLAGTGFGNYHNVCSRYYDRVDPAFPMRTWAHNSLLSLLAETGPLGLASALWLVAATARALLARLREGAPFALGAIAAACGLFTAGQVHDVIYDTKVMYPLWMALALGLSPATGAAAAASSTEPDLTQRP